MLNRRPFHAVCSTLGRLSSHCLLLGLAIGIAMPAGATLVDRTLRWYPSTSANVVGYELGKGTGSGTYPTRSDLGLPTVQSGVMSATIRIDDAVDTHVVLRARSSNGLYSVFSNEVVFKKSGSSTPGGSGSPPTTSPILPGWTPGALLQWSTKPVVGLDADASGRISFVGIDGFTVPFVSDSLASTVAIRPVWCELDGEGELDLVIGLAEGGRGRVIVLLLAAGGQIQARVDLDLGSTRVSVPNPTGPGSSYPLYADLNGATWPACGDLDGDGLDEIAVGLGGTGNFNKVRLFDDFGAGLRELSATAGAPTLVARGGTDLTSTARPTIGDFDGDGLDELAVGAGEGTEGWISFFDDAAHAFAPLSVSGTAGGQNWVPISPELPYEGGVYPSAGNLDGDARDEILVGLGIGGDGRLFVVADRQANFVVSRFPGADQSMVFGGSVYRAANGSLVPRVDDLDGDGRGEIVVGLGEGWDRSLLVLDDHASGFVAYVTPLPPRGTVSIPGGTGRRIVPAPRPID